MATAEPRLDPLPLTATCRQPRRRSPAAAAPPQDGSRSPPPSLPPGRPGERLPGNRSALRGGSSPRASSTMGEDPLRMFFQVSSKWKGGCKRWRIDSNSRETESLSLEQGWCWKRLFMLGLLHQLTFLCRVLVLWESNLSTAKIEMGACYVTHVTQPIIVGGGQRKTGKSQEHVSPTHWCQHGSFILTIKVLTQSVVHYCFIISLTKRR